MSSSNLESGTFCTRVLYWHVLLQRTCTKAKYLSTPSVLEQGPYIRGSAGLHSGFECIPATAGTLELAIILGPNCKSWENSCLKLWSVRT